uniref:Uncharacterized protein n=1 Tax=Anguilla anguilla TaxID=7936 RepID=A0A0E9SA46_ANGAN
MKLSKTSTHLVASLTWHKAIEDLHPFHRINYIRLFRTRLLSVSKDV